MNDENLRSDYVLILYVWEKQRVKNGLYVFKLQDRVG